MKRDDRGLSLVEMIIVIAILAVVSGIVVLGISAAISKPAEECARKIQQSLQSARVYTMGKQTLSLKFYMKNGCVYVEETATLPDGSSNTKTPVKISAKGVKVSFRQDGATDYSDLGVKGSANELTLSYDRATGGFNKSACAPGFCDKIRVEKGNKVMTVSLYSLTGKVTVE